MKTLILFLLLYCLTVFSASAQKETNNWFFGDHAGITFQNGTATAYGGGQIDTDEGCASISDKSTGKLLFYTDGVTIWNGNHQVMKNGTGLKGGKSCTQSALIVPNTGNDLQYYIFTAPDITGNTGVTALYYSIVSLETPLGEVISKNNFVIDSVAEKLTGTIDCSGTGFWIVTHHKSSNIFYSFHLTSAGLNSSPIISTYNEGTINHTGGYIKISPNGSKIGLASPWNGNSLLALFDFNSATGEVSNYMPLSYTSGGYGVSFSPDNTKLYVSDATGIGTSMANYYIRQYEINLPDIVSIRNSLHTIPLRIRAFALQLASDGKLYIAYLNYKSVGVINRPNFKGNSCSYQEGSMSLSGKCKYGLPNFMDYNFGHSTDTAVICLSNTSRIGPPAFSGYSYSWSPATGLDNPSIANPIASPPQTTEYTLKVTNTNGGVI